MTIDLKVTGNAFKALGVQDEGMKGVLALAPKSSNLGKLDLSARLVNIGHSDNVHLTKFEHSELMMKDPAADKVKLNSIAFKVSKALGKELPKSLFVGGYRAFFKADDTSNAVHVTIDKSLGLGPLRPLSENEDPSGEWNTVLDQCAGKLVNSFTENFPDKTLSFECMKNEHGEVNPDKKDSMQEFVKLLNSKVPSASKVADNTHIEDKQILELAHSFAKLTIN